MQWPLLHRNHPSPQVFDAERYNIMNNQWFCAYSYRINLIEMVSVIEYTRIYHHAVMQTLLNFAIKEVIEKCGSCQTQPNNMKQFEIIGNCQRPTKPKSMNFW